LRAPAAWPLRRWQLLGTTLAAAALVAAALAEPTDRRLQAFVLLALLCALWRIGRALAVVLVPELSSLSSAVAAFTFAAAFGSLAATSLGHFGVLRPAAFLLVAAAALSVAELARRRSVATAEPAAGSTADGAGDEESTGTRDPEPSSGAAEPPLPRWRALVDRWETIAALATVAAVGLGYLAQAVQRFARPLTGGPDDLSYHLTAVAVWQRWGDLRMVKFSMGDWGTVFYPILPEISSWILLAPFRDSDVAARWSELPYALLSLVAVAALARRLGLGWRSAVLAAAFYGLLNRVVMFTFAAGNDHVTAFATLAALDAALAGAERPRAGRFAYLGTALGLLVASKYMGIYNAITVLAVFGVAWLVHRRRRAGEDGAGLRRSPAVGAAVLLAALAVTGGYTYLRNWVTTGNPVYPQPVQVGELELFAGRAELSLGGRRSGGPDVDVWEFLTGPDNLVGTFVPFTLLPATLLAPLWAAARRRWLAAAVLALPAVFFLEFLYWTWDHRDIRYFLAGVALAAVAFSWLSERLGPLGAGLRTLTLWVLLYRYVRWLGTRGERELITAVLLIVAVAMVWRSWPAWRRRASAAAVPLLAVVALAATAALGVAVASYQRVKLSGSPAAMALERLAGVDGATVGYVGLNQPYLFFGSRLQNDVRVVPRSFNLRAEFYRWGGRPEPPFPRSTYARWLGVMKIIGVRYVVVFRSPDEDPERTWMANHPDRFHRLHVDAQTEIWKVVRMEPPRPGARAARAQRVARPPR
jgi:hypothetical protein